MNELCQLSATAAVALLKQGKVSPLEMIDAAAERIAETNKSLYDSSPRNADKPGK